MAACTTPIIPCTVAATGIARIRGHATGVDAWEEEEEEEEEERVGKKIQGHQDQGRTCATSE